MPIYPTTALTGFWIAMPHPSSTTEIGPSLQVSPAPTRVEYPNALLGEQVETADGRVVVQASTRDPRRRTWLWSNFGPEATLYERQHHWLQNLVARRRLAQGLPPYVYVYDSVSGLLNGERQLVITPSNVSGITITIPTLPQTVVPAQLRNAVVEVLPAVSNGAAAPYERRSVLAATSNTLTIASEFSGALGVSNILLSWSEPAWWKARVLDATRELRGDGGSVRYSASKFMFVIDEELPV